MSKTCKYCGKILPDEALYCSGCGCATSTRSEEANGFNGSSDLTNNYFSTSFTETDNDLPKQEDLETDINSHDFSTDKSYYHENPVNYTGEYSEGGTDPEKGYNGENKTNDFGEPEATKPLYQENNFQHSGDMHYTYSEPAQKSATDNEKQETVSVWTFVGLKILFAIPILGFVCKIIFSFVPDNKNTLNYSRAELIVEILKLFIFIIFAVLMYKFISEILPEIIREYPGIIDKIPNIY